MRYVWLVLLACALGAEEQEIRVHLATETVLAPLYLSSVRAERSPFPASYAAELQAVLEFDLNYNGETRVLPRSAQKEQTPLQAAAWREAGAAYVVQARVVERSLDVLLLTTETGAVQQFRDIPLSGKLAEDRRQMHKVADGILKTLFQREGVASTRLLYALQSPQAGWLSEIWESDWDGHNARPVTQEKSYCVTPVLIPPQSQHGADRFLYVSYKGGQPKIYIASLKEGKGKRFIALRGNQLLPAVSRSRDKIAFICDAGGRTDLFVQSLHPATGEMGKPVQLFSYPRSTQASPAFSPDGSTIAFVSDKDGPPRIYTIPAAPASKRAAPTLITKRNTESSCPAWSPDGTKLAYSAKTKGVRQIWIYDFALREEMQLTYGPGNKENPCWAPDSLHLVFNSTDATSSELYLVNLHQPDAVQISRGSGKKHYPTWGTK
jgi:TolB protein